MMRARTLGTIQRLSGHASDQAPYRVLKVAPPMGHRSATVVVYFVGTHLTWRMRVLGQWTWAVGPWAFYLWSLVLGFGLVYLRRRFVFYIMNNLNGFSDVDCVRVITQGRDQRSGRFVDESWFDLGLVVNV